MKKRIHSRRRSSFERIESRLMLDGHGIDLEVEASDLDGSGVVDFGDFLTLSRNFGQEVASRARGDIDGNGVVGFADFLKLSGNFGKRHDNAGNGNNGNNGNGNGGDPPRRQPLPPRGPLENASFRQSRRDFTSSLSRGRGHGSPFAGVAENAEAVFYPVLQAGSLTADPSDAPSSRIDPNTESSPYAGVGSIEVTHPSLGTFLCTGTPITPTQVLTAGHCFDQDGDGGTDDGVEAVFYLNNGSDLRTAHTVTNIAIHPDYDGFSGAVNDDLAVIDFGVPLPTDTPIYRLSFDAMPEGQTIEMVGYGQSGHGDTGFTVVPDYTDKRVGQNNADLFIVDDDVEGNEVEEIFMFDFDSPDGDLGFFGGPSLGNDIETTFGGGDSGGPSFVDIDGEKVLFGVNTFNFEMLPTTEPVGFFRSLGGGVILGPYVDWFASVSPGSVPGNNAPSFSTGPNVEVLEDAGAQQITWASDISANDPDQVVAFQILSNSNPELFSVQPQLEPNGILMFTAAANANGTATLEVNLTDDGGTQHGGADTGPTTNLTITVSPVNDAPTFMLIGNVVADQDAGPQVIEAFATGFDAGPGEADQAISQFGVVTTNLALFDVAPAIDVNGQLTFTPNAEASGQATILVRVVDDGGVANGGVDQSSALTFTVTVNAVDPTDPTDPIDPTDPGSNLDLTFTLAGDIVVEEDAGRQNTPRFATEISPEIVDFLVTNDNEELFLVAPDIQLGRGQLRFRTAENAFGEANVSVTAIGENGTLSDAMRFVILVTPEDDPVDFVVPTQFLELRDAFVSRLAEVEDFPQVESLTARMNRIVENADADYAPAAMRLSAMQNELMGLSGSNLVAEEDLADLLAVVRQMLDFVAANSADTETAG